MKLARISFAIRIFMITAGVGLKTLYSAKSATLVNALGGYGTESLECLIEYTPYAPPAYAPVSQWDSSDEEDACLMQVPLSRGKAKQARRSVGSSSSCLGEKVEEEDHYAPPLFSAPSSSVALATMEGMQSPKTPPATVAGRPVVPARKRKAAVKKSLFSNNNDASTGSFGQASLLFSYSAQQWCRCYQYLCEQAAQRGLIEQSAYAAEAQKAVFLMLYQPASGALNWQFWQACCKGAMRLSDAQQWNCAAALMPAAQSVDRLVKDMRSTCLVQNTKAEKAANEVTLSTAESSVVDMLCTALRPVFDQDVQTYNLNPRSFVKELRGGGEIFLQKIEERLRGLGWGQDHQNELGILKYERTNDAAHTVRQQQYLALMLIMKAHKQGRLHEVAGALFTADDGKDALSYIIKNSLPAGRLVLPHVLPAMSDKNLSASQQAFITRPHEVIQALNFAYASYMRQDRMLSPLLTNRFLLLADLIEQLESRLLRRRLPELIMKKYYEGREILRQRALKAPAEEALFYKLANLNQDVLETINQFLPQASWLTSTWLQAAEQEYKQNMALHTA